MNSNITAEISITISLVETCLTFMQWALKVIKTTDRVTAFLVFIAFLFVYFGSMIYIYGHINGGLKRQKRTRKIKKQHNEACAGRQSARLKLRKHELMFIERITPEDFDY